MELPKYENIIADGDYLVDALTGKRVVFYECDPAKNHECVDRGICHFTLDENNRDMGGCSKTINPEYRRIGGRCWYSVLKTPEEGERFWGREYIEEA